MIREYLHVDNKKTAPLLGVGSMLAGKDD